MTEKNVDKIKTGDNIISSSAVVGPGSGGRNFSGSSTEVVPGSSADVVPVNKAEVVPGSNGGAVSGIVKWFSPEKGFGFVTCGNGMDIFVYYTEIQTEGFKTLQKGQKVQLEIFSGERGFQASNVRLI